MVGSPYLSSYRYRSFSLTLPQSRVDCHVFRHGAKDPA